MRTDRWRYTEWLEIRAESELYNYSVDSEEVDDLADDPKYADKVAKLSKSLQTFVKLKPHKRHDVE